MWRRPSLRRYKNDSGPAVHSSPSEKRKADDWELDAAKKWKASEEENETDALLRWMGIDPREELRMPDQLDEDYNAYGLGPNGNMFWRKFIGSAYDPEC